jgi:hypothetical protein
VEYPAALHALGLASSTDGYDVALGLSDGRIVRTYVAAVDRRSVPFGFLPPQLWLPQPLGSEKSRGWRAANATTSVPLYLAEPEKFFRMVDLPGMRALYVQFRSNHNEAGQEITPFVALVMRRLAAHPRNVILDLRFDTGGNNELTLDLMRAIPQYAPGRTYVMTGRYTFSAGIASAAAVKRAGGARVTIIGEPAGDNLRWWSEGESSCLPRSDLCLHATTGLWDLAHGCAAEPHCYSDKYDVVVGTLRPQIAAPLTSRAWLAGDDPGMDAIARDLHVNAAFRRRPARSSAPARGSRSHAPRPRPRVASV